MSFKFEQGLFGLDFTDHHAILGVPVNADIKEIRKRYLKIARRLHPDSSALKDTSDRQQANELLSKLVNPSYEFLSQEKNLAEYNIILKLKGEQAQRQQDTIVLTTDVARKLVSAPNLDHAYQMAIAELSESQYEALDKTQKRIGQLSEINLVYLMRRVGNGQPSAPLGTTPAAASSATKTGAGAAPSAASAPKKEAPAPASRDDLIDSFIRRADEFEKKRDFARSILELREALKLKPNSAVCHSRLGMVYLKTKQPKMAKIHFSKALDLDPKDEVAKVGLQSLDPSSAASSGSSASPSASKTPPAKSAPPKSGGGLFGLFGNKKK